MNKKVKRPPGRPRTGIKPAAALRLSPEILEQIDRIATNSGRKRSDVLRELVEEAIAGRKAAAKRRPAKRKESAE